MQENMSPSVLILKHTPSHFFMAIFDSCREKQNYSTSSNLFFTRLLPDQILNMPESPST